MVTRTLLTGATGFIGRHALRHLVGAGHEVHALARRAGDPQPGVVWHEYNLLEPGSASTLLQAVRPNRLLHLAWNATPGQFWTAVDNVDWVAATLELHMAFVRCGGERAVYAGTCAEYDWDYSELSERNTPLKPNSLYGLAKETTCRLLLAATERAGPRVAWGRIFFVYGPYETTGRLVSDITISLLRGQPVECTDGMQERDFMHVDDVARAFVTVLNSDHVGPVNIASGICRPVRELVLEIGRVTGGTGLIRLGARARPVDDPSRLAADVSILHGQLGFRPRFALEEGIANTVEEWRRRVEASAAPPRGSYPERMT